MSVTPVEYLLSRRSCKFTQAPGPTQEQLSQILQSAMSAPDHGRLQPWRFALIEGDAIGRLADLSLAATKAAGIALSPEKEASTRRWLSRIPLLIGVACRLDHSNTKIPESERILATGASVTNILNAAHMLGYGAYWSTGLGTYLDEVSEALGFDSLDYRFMGYVSIGTPIDPPREVPRSDYHEFIRDWTGV